LRVGLSGLAMQGPWTRLRHMLDLTRRLTKGSQPDALCKHA